MMGLWRNRRCRPIRDSLAGCRRHATTAGGVLAVPEMTSTRESNGRAGIHRPRRSRARGSGLRAGRGHRPAIRGDPRPPSARCDGTWSTAWRAESPLASPPGAVAVTG